MKNNCGIYCWTNKVTGKKYIGQTIDLEHRKKQFLQFNTIYTGGIVDNEREKFPLANYWHYDILVRCKSEQLDELEKEYIKKVPLNETLNFEHNIATYNGILDKTKYPILNEYNFRYKLRKKILQFINKKAKWYFRKFIEIITDEDVEIIADIETDNFLTHEVKLFIAPSVFQKYNLNKYDLTDILGSVKFYSSWIMYFECGNIDVNPIKDTYCKITNKILLNIIFYEVIKELRYKTMINIKYYDK